MILNKLDYILEDLIAFCRFEYFISHTLFGYLLAFVLVQLANEIGNSINCPQKHIKIDNFEFLNHLDDTYTSGPEGIHKPICQTFRIHI